MIPSRHDYYRRRAREHRALAVAALAPDIRAMHNRLVAAYIGLARLNRPRARIHLKV